mgnify:FL=1
MKRFLLLVLLTQCSIASELSSAQLKAEIVALELMAEIKAEMAFHKAEIASLKLMAEIKAEMGVTECVWPDDKLIFSEYHSSLSSILLDYQKVSQ